MTLFDYQQQGLDNSVGKNRVAYYWDMGLGKTFVGTEKMKQLGESENLVICQKSKVKDWIDHLTEHTDYEVIDHTKSKVKETRHPCVRVINYDLVWRRDFFKNWDGGTLMVDESSLIQNRRNKRTKSIMNLRHKNLILLSGTPVSGKYERLVTQCNLLGWKITESEFWDRYVVYFTQDINGYPLKIVSGYKRVEELKAKLREHGAMFLKADEVISLPDKVFVDTSISSTAAYKRFQGNDFVEVGELELVGDTLLSKLLYSRMLCGQYNDHKLAALKSLMESTDDRLLVFYNFQAEYDAIQELTDKPLSVINGQTKDLMAYETQPNSVTLIQYQAGAMGLNLQKANKIVYFTPPLSSELYEQSQARTRRIGQNRTCFYYRLICENSVEEKIYDTLATRHDYTERLFK